MDSKALLSLNHLSVWYTADHPLLSDFSLDLGAAEDQSFRYFTFREYLTYVAASYGVPLPDLSGLIRGFHFENYANVLLSVADLLPLPAIALARGVAAREMLVLPLSFLAIHSIARRPRKGSGSRGGGRGVLVFSACVPPPFGQ